MTQKLSADMQEIKIATDVLVIGGGYTGVKTANEIAGLGYRAILVENGTEIGNQTAPWRMLGLPEANQKGIAELIEKAGSNGQIEVMTQTRLVEAAGVTGDFSVGLQSADETVTRKVGAIVVATDASVEPLNAAYDLELSDTVIAQSALDSMIASNADNLSGKTVAILAGFGQEGNPLVMERVFRSVLALQQLDCTVYVYVNNLKVAEDCLERLYLQSRDAGAIYFKLEKAPAVSQANGSLGISFQDPVMRQEMQLNPDVIVIEEGIQADQLNVELAGLLRIDLGPQGFLQTDNVHRFPVQSNREGIFVTGFSREIKKLTGTFVDADNAALEVKKLLGDGIITAPVNKAVVDTGKCTICLTCYRCCPHGAIYWEGDKAVISPVACQGCGICASECPMNAIQIADFSDETVMDSILENLKDSSEEPQIVAFCCQNSALEAAQMATDFNLPLPAGLKLIKVPCAGKVDIDFIMSAFAEGADGVLVLTCHDKNCKSERGNLYAGWRVSDAQRMMEEAGLEKERLRHATIASNMGSDFSAIVVDMSNKLGELGLSPIKK